MSAMTHALDDLHRMHDRPLPAAELRAALLGGPGAAARFGAEVAAASQARLAAQVRVAIARRRLQVRPGADPWLDRLVADLAWHRSAALAWCDRAEGRRKTEGRRKQG